MFRIYTVPTPPIVHFFLLLLLIFIYFFIPFLDNVCDCQVWLMISRDDSCVCKLSFFKISFLENTYTTSIIEIVYGFFFIFRILNSN